MRGRNVKRVVKLAISLLYFFVEALCRLVLKARRRSTCDQLVILYYHGVPDAYRANFVRQLESLRAVRILPASYRGPLPSGKQNVAITFDDAYVSVAENALPELAARGFHCTIFVPVGSLGRRPIWPVEDGSLDSDEIVMSTEGITSLSSSLVALGSHSRTHPRLSRIGTLDAQNEIEGSRHELQSLTKTDIRLFSFPYGDYDAATIESCRAAGYDYVFDITPRPVDTESPGFVRGRVRVEPSDGPLEFFLKYNGAYSWASPVSALRKKLRSILIGVSRYHPHVSISRTSGI
jgi:peptidoglycan/xylan/chitin deacetylase (PgdA/CDA1 family)